MTDKPTIIQQLKDIENQVVVVATDFSNDSKAAILWACEFAACFSRGLLILHVVHDPASSPGFYKSEEFDGLQPIQTVAESMMTRFLTEMRLQYPQLDVLSNAKNISVKGLPAGRIVEVAELMNASLIVVGSRGMTGLPHIMLGSVAEKVIELTSKPVVVVKDENNTAKKKKKKKKKN